MAIVTGAAGGIGSAIARALGYRGVRVAAIDRDAARLADEVAKLAVDGLTVEAIDADVTDGTDARRAVRLAEDRLGPVDYLVNGAGVLRLGTVSDLTEQDWAESFAVNATGVFHMSRAVAERMVPRSRGAIVTVASNAAGTPRTRMAAYCAAKAAATMFTKCLGLELAEHGIRCNVVAPGSTDTPMLRSMWHDESGPRATVGGALDQYRVGIPLGRIAKAADVAEAVVFLLSDQASHITMHDLTVDGGATLGV